MAWFRSRNQDWRTFIIETEVDPRPIGVLTIGQLDYWEFEIGVLIGELSLWGKGYAKQAVNLGLEYGKSLGKKYSRTTILDSNEASIHLFGSLGYVKMCVARLGESLYRKWLV